MKLGYQVPIAELKISFARSGGKGGQNVNKVNTKVEIRWDLNRSRSLPASLRARLLASPHLKPYITTRGELVVTDESSRSQLHNRITAEDKLCELVRRALKTRKKRIPTKRSRAANEKRLYRKKIQGEKKDLRRDYYE